MRLAEILRHLSCLCGQYTGYICSTCRFQNRHVSSLFCPSCPFSSPCIQLEFLSRAHVVPSSSKTRLIFHSNCKSFTGMAEMRSSHTSTSRPEHKFHLCTSPSTYWILRLRFCKSFVRRPNIVQASSYTWAVVSSNRKKSRSRSLPATMIPVSSSTCHEQVSLGCPVQYIHITVTQFQELEWNTTSKFSVNFQST